MKTIFVAKDGKQFGNRQACQIYEKTIGKKVVEDYNELVNLIVNKEKIQEIDNLDDLYEFAKQMVTDYEKENDKLVNLYVMKRGNIISEVYGESLVEEIFKSYYKKIVREYFIGFENASDEKIAEVFAHAYGEYHRYGFQGVIDEFDSLITLIQNFI